MERPSYSPLSFSILALLVVMVFAPVYLSQVATAQSPYELSKITGFGSGDIIGADYDEIEDVLWVMTSQDTGSFRIGRAYSVNATTDAVITNAVVYNETNTANVLLDFDCNYPFCYFTHGSGTSNEDGEVYRFSIVTTTATINTSIDKTLANSSDDYAYLVAAESGSFGGTNLIFSRVVNSGGTTTLRGATFDGLSVDMDASSPLTKTFDSGLASHNHYFTSMKWSLRNAPDNDVFGSAIVTNGATQAVYVYSLDGDAPACENLTVSNDSLYGGVVPDHVDYNYFYVGAASGNIHAFNIDDCTAAYSITSAETGLSNDVFDLSIIEIADTKYLVARDVGSGGNISFMPYNEATDEFETYDFLINSAPSSQQGNAGTGTQTISHTTVGRIVNGYDVGKMFIPMTNTDRAILVIDIGSSFEEEEEEGGYNQDGGEGGNALTIDLVNAPENFLSDMLTVDTETANMIATGIVHAIFLIAPMAMVISKGGDTKHVPLFVWAILALMAGGICVALGWMPLLFLFAEIVIIAASFAFLMSRGVSVS